MRSRVITKSAVKFDRTFYILPILEKTIYSVFLTRFYLALVNAQAFL